MLETEMRDWLRKSWNTQGKNQVNKLVWVEPGRGGTVGMPDVMIPFAGSIGLLPVELKVWEVKKEVDWPSSFKMDARPTQIHYHARAAAGGIKTAFLVATKTDGPSMIFAFPGSLLGLGQGWVSTNHMKLVGHEAERPAFVKDRLRVIFKPAFWSMAGA